jgi:hypothetical protein
MNKDGLERDLSGAIKDARPMIKKIASVIANCLGTSFHQSEKPDYYSFVGNVGDVKLYVSRPRPYMGRFDAGKGNWTVDVKEQETHSRTLQVRVKFKDCEPYFNCDALKEKIQTAQAIASAHKNEKSKEEDGKNEIPKHLPRNMWIDYNVQTNDYTIRYTVKAEKMKQVVSYLKKHDIRATEK